MNSLNTSDSTNNFYDNNAQVFIAETINVDMQALYKPFISSLAVRNRSPQCILDLGCGSGRDSLYFAKLGFDVTAIDSSCTLIELAKQTYQQNDICKGNIDWQILNFQNIAQKNWQKYFTGIWACASLLHVPYIELPMLIGNLLDTLTVDGVFYASFKYGESEHINEGRFFCDMNETRWEAIKLKLDNKINDTTWLTSDQRENSYGQWFNVLIEV